MLKGLEKFRVKDPPKWKLTIEHGKSGSYHISRYSGNEINWRDADYRTFQDETSLFEYLESIKGSEISIHYNPEDEAYQEICMKIAEKYPEKTEKYKGLYLPKQKRPETGPMEFGDDWRGIFIRGDNALMYYLPGLMEAKKRLQEVGCGPEYIVTMSAIDGLIGVLSSAAHSENKDGVQVMKPFVDCVKR